MFAIKLVDESTDWKDKVVGWHGYEGTSICPDCGQRFRTVLYGTIGDVEAWNGLCEDCDV